MEGGKMPGKKDKCAGGVLSLAGGGGGDNMPFPFHAEEVLVQSKMSIAKVIRRAGRAVWRGIGLSMQFGMDAVVLAVAYLVARLARFEFSWAQGMTGKADWLPQLVWVVGVQLAMLLLFRVYRRMWRFTGFVDVPTYAWPMLGSGVVRPRTP